MTNYSWKTGTSGNWNNSGAWVGGIPNGTTADVTIEVAGAYTVTLPSGTAYTVDSIVLDNASASFTDSGTLNLGGTLASFTFDGNQFNLGAAGVISGGLLDIDSGILFNQGGTVKTRQFVLGDSGTIALNGKSLTLAGTSTLDGGIFGNDAAGNTLVVMGNASIDLQAPEYIGNKATLVVGGTLTEAFNAGYGLTLGYNQANDSSSIVIKSGGVFNLAGNGGIGFESGSGIGSIANSGVFEGSNNGSDYAAVYVVNTGTILSAAHNDLMLSGGGSLGGTLAGAGEIDFGGGNFTFSPTIAISAGTLGFDAGVVTLGGNLALTDHVTIAGGTLALNGHNLSLLSPVLGSGGGIFGPGTVTVSGNTSLLASSSYMLLAGGATLAVNGSLLQTYPSEAFFVLGDSSTTATLLINAGATYSMVGAGYGERILDQGQGTVINAGLLKSSNTDSEQNFITATLISTGTIESDLGSLELGQGGRIGGKLTGAGEIDFTGGNFTLAPNIAISTATLGFDGGVVTLGGNLDLSGSAVTDNYGTIELAGHHLTLAGATLEGNGDFYGAGTVTLTGLTSETGFYVVDNAVVEVTGTLAQTSGGLNFTVGGGDTAVIQIDAGATYDLDGTGNAYGITDNYGGGTLGNAGLVVSNYGPAGTDLILATVNSTGTIESDAGIFEMQSGGTIGGLLTGAGEIDFFSGNFSLAAGLQVSGNTTIGVDGGLVTLGSDLAPNLFNMTSGTIALNGHNVTIGGNGVLAGEIDGPGTVTVLGTRVIGNLNLNSGATLVDAGTFVQTGQLYLGTGATPSGPLVINAGAVYDMIGQGNLLVQNAEADSLNGSIVNAGTLVSSEIYYGGAGQGPNVLDAYVINTGTLDAQAGVLRLGFGGALDGTLMGQEIDLANTAVFTLAPTAVLSVATLDLGSELVFTNNETYAGAFRFESGNADLYLNGRAVTLSGPAYLDSGMIMGGLLRVTGAAADGGLNVINHAVLEDSGTITQANNLQLANGDSGTLAIDAHAVYNLQNQGGVGFNINENGDGEIYNAGLFELTGYAASNQSSQINATAQNTGTIADIGAGNLYFEANAVNDGLITLASVNAPIGAAVMGFADSLTADAGKTGTIVLGANAVLEAAGTVSGQKILFTTAGSLGSVLEIGDLPDFSGTVAGFAGGDVIDLQNVLANGATYAGNILTLTETATGSALALVGTLALSGVTGTIALDSDGNAGTEILLNEPAATYSNPKTAPTASTWFGGAGNWATAADWSPAGQPGSNAIAQINDANTYTIAYSETDTVYQLDNSNAGAKLFVEGGRLTDESGGFSTGTLQVNGANFDALTGFDFYGLVSLASNGTLEADTGTMLFDGGAVLAGTIAGDGRLDGSLNFGAGNVLLNSGFTVQAGAATLYFTGAALNLGASQTLSAPIAIEGSSVNFAGHTLVLSGASEIEGNAAFVGPGTLNITGTAALGNLSMSGNANLADNRLILQNNAVSVGNALNDTSSILISAGATYALADDGSAFGIQANGGNGSAGTLKNAGLLELTGYGNDTDMIALPIFNTGTILAAEGELQFAGGGTLGGTLAGNGVIDLYNGTFTLGTLADNVATLALSGNYGTVPELALGGHTLVLGQTAYFGSSSDYFEVTGAGKLDITGTAYADDLDIFGNAVLEVAGTLAASGPLNLAADVNGDMNANDTTTLLIDAGGTFALADQGAGQVVTAIGKASVVNHGLLETTGGSPSGTINYIEAPIFNTGTILVNGTDLQFNAGGTLGGTLAGSGEIDLTAGKFVLASLSSGVALLNASYSTLSLGSNGTISGGFTDANGTIALAGHVLTLSGASDLLANTVYGPGTIKVTGTVALTETSAHQYLLGGAVLEDAGTIIEATGYSVNPSVTGDYGNVVIDSGALFNLGDGSGIYAATAGSVANAGTLLVTGGGLLAAPLTNTGTLDIASGVLEMRNGGTLGGLVTGPGQLDISQGSVLFAPGLSLSVGSISNEARVVLGGDAAYGGTLNDTGTISLGGHHLTLSGGAGLLAGTVAGAGTLLATGTLAITSATGENLYLGGGAQLEDAGTVSAITGASLFFGTGGNDSGSLLVDAGAVFNIATSGIYVAGKGAITNNGTFTATGGAPISAAVTNNGSFMLAGGMLAGSGALTNTGLFDFTSGQIGETGGILNSGLFLADLGAGNTSNIGTPFDNSGTLVAANGTLLVSGGGVLGGTIGGGAGTIVLNSDFAITAGTTSTVTFASGAQFGTSGTAIPGGNNTILDGAGTLVTAGTLAIADNGANFDTYLTGGPSWVDTGTVNDSGWVGFGLNFSPDSGTLGIASSGAFNFSGDDGNLLVSQSDAGYSDQVNNAGLLEKTGGTGTSTVAVTVSNTGTIAALSGTLALTGAITNDANGTLTGGTWEASGPGSTLALLADPVVTTDAANIILAGYPTGGEIYSGATAPQAIEASLQNIAASGTLQVLGFDTYVEGTAVTDAGVIDLGGGNFVAPTPYGLTIAPTGTLQGFGMVNGSVQNNGLITALGKLTLGNPVTGTGTIAVSGGTAIVLGSSVGTGQTVAFGGANALLVEGAPASMSGTLAGLGLGDTIDISSVTVNGASLAGSDLFITLSNQTVLDDKLTAPITGERFAITSDGGNGSDLVLYRDAAGSVAPSALAFGNHHVGDTVSSGLTIANTAASDGYSEGLDASFTTHLGSLTTTGTLTTLAAGATNSTALTIGLLTGAPGSISGDAVVTLASDGAGTDGNAPIGLGSQTIAVTGAVYAYAAPTLRAGNIALGQVHTNAADLAYVTLSNTAGNPAFTEGLDASFTGTSGAATAFGTIALLAAGAANGTVLSVGLRDNVAGSLTGVATLGLASDGALTSHLGTTALPAQAIVVSGAVFNLATAGGLPGTISLGQHHTGTAYNPYLTLANSAAPGAYSENLDASFSGSTLTAGSFSTAGSVTTLAAGASSAASLQLKTATGTAGTISGKVLLTLTSDGAGIDSLGKTGLGIDTIAVTGAIFNEASASSIATLSLGQHHAGLLNTGAISLKNTAAAGAYSEGLDAKFTGTSLSAGSLTTGGTIALLAAGASSSALAVTLAGTGGIIAGNATIGLTSDGTGIDTLGLTALSAQTIAVTGTLFNEATAGLGAATLALGQFHAGATATSAITLANAAPAGLYSESLDASFSGTSLTHGSFSVAGAVTQLAAGGTDATDLAISLATGTAGTITGTATLALKSDGTGIDTLGTTVLAAKTEAVSAAVFAYAAPKLASTVVNFGILHAGTAATQALVLGNANPTPGFTESLDAGFTGASSGVAASGSIALLGAGLTNSSSLVLGFAAAQNGAVSGTATLGLTSDGAGIDTLGTTALGSDVITLTGTIDNYATAALEEISGAGTLTGSGGNYFLDLGNIQQGGPGVSASLGVLNAATGVADSLSGSFVVSNPGGFTDTGFGTFSGVAAGQADSAPAITLSAANAGAFSELITLSPVGSNASGYKAGLGNITLAVTGNVLHTYTLTGGADTLTGAGNDLIVAKSGQLSAGDIINAGTGTNILTLSGGGMFDMTAPATLTGISIVEAQENVGTLAQTLDIRSGFGGVVNAASGPGGSSLTVVGNYGGATINLGNGNDTVYINAPNGTVNGGGGNDTFYVGDSDTTVIGGNTISTTINGGAGTNTLEVAGGSAFTMGDNITSISDVVINEPGGQSETFVANGIAGLTITGGAGDDLITLGDASQSVITGTGNSVIYATAGQAGALIDDEGSATLDLTTGGSATLNAADEFLTVSLATGTGLTLSAMPFITAIGSAGADTITAMAAQQTLTGGPGVDTLIGYAGFGDMFQDTAAGLNGDTIQYFGGSDLIDLTNIARAGATLAYSGSSTNGTLSVTGGGITTSISLSSGSNLAQSLFHMNSDGHGGTNIALI